METNTNIHNIHPEEEIKFIQQVLDRARNKYSDTSIFFIFWGWVLVFYLLLNGIFLMTNMKEILHYLWLIMPAGGIITPFLLKKQKTRTFYSYLDHYLRGIWYGFLVALLASILILIFYDYNLGMSMILFNMAWATFASGFVLELPSMKWGGGAGFVLSILSFIIPTPWKFFFMAFSTIVIYLIPGYNLKTQFQNKEKEQ